MREILFRGKRKDNGKWAYGFYALFASNKGLKHGIYTGTENGYVIPYEVDPETVGQFTGLTDKNGKKIFEGDIMQLCSACYPCLVYWDGKGWAWKQNGKRREIDLTREKMDTIGNIYDNPELLRSENG